MKKFLIPSIIALALFGTATAIVRAEDGGASATTTHLCADGRTENCTPTTTPPVQPTLVPPTVPTNTDFSTLTRDQLLVLARNQKAELDALRARLAGTPAGQCVNAAQNKIEFLKKLFQGQTDDDVKNLQKILATDKSIYPEGRITGFFGPLTTEALKRFQTKFGLTVTGTMTDETQAMINKLLADQSVTTTVPPGLLIAPGLHDKMHTELEKWKGEHMGMMNGSDDDQDSGTDDSDSDSDN